MLELGGQGAAVGVLHVLHHARQRPLLPAPRVPSRQTAGHKEQPVARACLAFGLTTCSRLDYRRHKTASDKLPCTGKSLTRKELKYNPTVWQFPCLLAEVGSCMPSLAASQAALPSQG